MESGESPETEEREAQPPEATEHQQELADRPSPTEPTVSQEGGATADQPPLQDQETEGGDHVISADNEGERERDQHVTESQATNGRVPEHGEEVDKATDVQLATETETGAVQEGGEEVQKPTDVQLATETETEAVQEGGEVTQNPTDAQLAAETETEAVQEGGEVTHEEGAGKESEMKTPSTEASKQESPEGDQGDRKSGRSTTEKSHTSAQSEGSRKEKGKDKEKEKAKGKEKKRDKHRDKEKKQKKRSKQQGHDESPHTTRKHPSKFDTHSQQSGGGNKQLEAILLSVFQPFDPNGTGYMEPSVFWEVLQSSEINLQLANGEVATLQEVIQPDPSSGQIPYGEFATHAADVIASLYQNQPASDAHWVELRAADGSVVVSYNKQTAEVRDMAETGIDLFEDIIKDMFTLADAQDKGYVSREEFAQMLQSEQMTPYLTEEDILQMQQYFDTIPSTQATYSDFYPLAKELILRVYRVKDPSESEWCQLNSPRVGLFWFNKYTGETRRKALEATAPGDREQEIAFLQQAYAQLESTNFELEQYKQENRELHNMVAQADEEQEALATQLYETGHALDEATAEIQVKEMELEELRAVVSGKEGEIEAFKSKVADFERLKEKLMQTEQELQNARDTIAARDRSVAERDTSIAGHQRQIEALTDRLKTSHGTVDARDSSISSLQHQLRTEQARTKQLEKQVPSLESRISALQDELKSTQHTLEEKTSSLAQARKHLRNARERNMDLERDVEKLSQTHENLRRAESEIHTLKSFLTSKTAMIERRKKELQDVRTRLAELEEKDSRRAVILADVLEKTARQYQQQLAIKTATPGATKTVSFQPELPKSDLRGTLPSDRPFSAPAIPTEDELMLKSMEETSTHKSLKPGKPAPTTAPLPLMYRATKPPGRKARIRSRSVPKLPPIHGRPQQREFTFSTRNELRHMYKEQDDSLVDHAPSNPQCNCKLCQMNASTGVQPETGLTGLATQTGMLGYRSEIGTRELTLSQQIQIGQRVLVRMKKSEYDLEPQKLTGVVKYVGKIDSEFFDNRLYVGLKLDEAVGDTDGLFKGKRYFTCPPKHGKVLRITNVIAVLPNKSVFYKQLQDASKRSPYGMTVQKKTGSLKVS